MVGNPLVSLVCPTFNRPRYVLHAVKVFLSQTWTRSELIVVDDSDRAHQVDLRSYPRVKHIRLGEWTPMGTKHNIGIDAAQGDVLGYQDDDDWFHPRRLVCQLQPLVLGLATVAGIPRDLVLSGGEFWRFRARLGPAAGWIGNGEATFKLPFHDGTSMYAREVLRHGHRHTPKTVNQKADFLNAITDAGEKWKAVPNNDLFVYIRHAKNTWQFRQDVALARASAPWWFPADDLEFYRRAS
jgi:glycosyltransferase involved in cell wall biosynthesis